MNSKSNPYHFPQWLLHSETYLLLVIDMKGLYVFVNECFRKRFHFLSDTFIGEHISGSVHPEDMEKCNTAVIACLKNPEIPQKVRIRKPSGQMGDYRFTDWEFSPHKNADGIVDGIICIGHDVTQPVKNENLIEDQYEKLKKIAWQQSHELRSPVVNILGCIQLIRNNKKLLSDEEENNLFEDIKIELSNLDAVIHKIVSSSQS